MISLLLLTMAHAEEPVPVDAVACTRPVHFATPYPWHWSAEPFDLVDGTALVVRVDPAISQPRAVGQRVLYVEGWPAEVLFRSGDLALVLAPLAVPTSVHAWYGDDTLPERVDAAHRKAQSDAALGLPGLTPKAIAPSLAWNGTRRALVTTLTEWMGICEGG